MAMIYVPDNLIKDILVGNHDKSAFVREAITEKLNRSGKNKDKDKEHKVGE